MSSSKLPAIRDALESLWRNADGLEGVTICRVTPDPEQPYEALIVGTARTRREYRSMGNMPTPYDENFSITCDVAAVQLGGDSYTPVEQRVYEILEAAETAFRANPNLDNLLIFARIATTEDNFEPVDKGRAASVRFVIEGKARI